MNNKVDKENQAILLFNSSIGVWEDKTSQITMMYNASYYGNQSGYNIYFRLAPKYYFYQNNNVRILDKLNSEDVSKWDVYVENKRVEALEIEKFSNNYYRVRTALKNYFTRAVRLESNEYQNIFNYFTHLANYASTVAEDSTPLYFLSRNYKQIGGGYKDSVLIDFLKGKHRVNTCRETLIFPFDYNQSQAKAIENALTNNISIIEGPPGTGKTQTILNLIANIVCSGKNCAVISNNNTAIENVFEKLEEENLSFIAASLGRRTNVQQFFENDNSSQLSEFVSQPFSELTKEEENRMVQLSLLMKQIQDKEVESALLEAQLDEVMFEKRYYEQITESLANINQKLSSKSYLWLIVRLQESRKIRLIERWLINFKYKIKLSSSELSNIIVSAELQYYKLRIFELNNQLESNKKFLIDHKKDSISKELNSLYRRSFENYLHKHYQKTPNESFTADNYKSDFNGFTQRYPVVLSTSQSLPNNTPSGFRFDYMIIDEASQGDLLSSTLAMSCAHNLVVVGDSRQLQQIDEEMLFEPSELLANNLNIPQAYRYSSNSILKSVKEAVNNVPTTLLKEHYRCAPDIINFCNKMFYDGELVAMTHNNGNHIEIIKTVPGNHARKNPNGSGMYNLREIDEIAHILQENDSKNIGIITPFRFQSEKITEIIASENLEVDTVHKFQGRQKEEIILSFVVNSLEQNENKEKNRLYDFVTNSQLLNVAISRGQKKVTAIVADKVYHSKNNIINDFIKYAEYLYGTDITKESTITSVFDLLYSEQSAALLEKYKNHPNEHKTELLMCEMIDELLVDYSRIGYVMHIRLGSIVKTTPNFSQEEQKYILHPWTHVDFLFYNKVSKQKLFVLEVDGIKYHEQDTKQMEHDNIKDRILKENQIDVYRFKTNESNEETRLRGILDGYYHI